MKIGITSVGLGPFSVPEIMAHVARTAEQSGFESLWAPDHSAIPDGHQTKCPYTPTGEIPGGPDAPFMTKALHTTDAGRRDLAAAVHVDGTARAQTVTEAANPLYYSLINAFGKATGVYGVLNTSFNLKGQPIVNTPRQALEMFQQSGMDFLIIGDFLVRR